MLQVCRQFATFCTTGHCFEQNMTVGVEIMGQGGILDHQKHQGHHHGHDDDDIDDSNKDDDNGNDNDDDIHYNDNNNNDNNNDNDDNHDDNDDNDNDDDDNDIITIILRWNNGPKDLKMGGRSINSPLQGLEIRPQCGRKFLV